MEPDNTADKAASMDMGSKQTYFESVGKSQQFSQTRNVENVRKGPPAHKSAHTSSHKFEDELEARIKEVSLRKSSGFSPNDLEVFQKPVCLMSTDEGNALKLETEAAEQIAKIDWPIVVVSVVGLYRTGKSYLMNRLAQSTTGFALGDTIESKTKGIWVWCKIHPEKTNTVLVLLDTEGLGDIDKGDPSHDNKIFTLATLLCNCLVYNMKGAFDQDAISKLTFITEMARNIRFRGKSSDDNSSLNLILPDFVLCVRDFGLRLIKDGKRITEDEYLESGLAIQEGRDDKFNKPRECIQKYFPVRKCFTFPVPGDGDVIENLETLDFSQLSKRFKEATNRFVSYIYSRKSKELLASKPINGQMFTTLATHYVTAIRHGAVPDVDDAFSAAAKIENSRIRKQALEIFQKQMETIILPVPSKVLEGLFMKAEQTALDYLRKDVVHDKDGQCEYTAQMEMDNLWNKLKEENTQKVQEKCEATIQQAYKDNMERKIENKTYEVSGGHRMFQRDITKMKKEFMSKVDFEENEMKENEENLKKLKEEHQKSEQNNLEKQRIAMEEHFKRLEHNRNKSNEKEVEKYKMFLKTKVEKEQVEKELQRVLKKQQKEKKRIDMEAEKAAKDRQLQASRAQNEMMERERKMEWESSCVIS